MNHETKPHDRHARLVTNALREAGYEALWAGGYVRDRLLKRTRHSDIDIATSATPKEVQELFGAKRTIAVGAAFGVIMVLAGRDEPPVEVATFRQDVSYSDGRRPDSVTFCSAEDDAARRDFTINGMFFDPESEEIHDFVGGKADLQAGLVRAIGDPHRRFEEDRLRLLRAVRFAAALDFTIEESTWTAIRSSAAAIIQISAERIQAELRYILTDPRRRAGVELLRASGLWDHVLPDLVPGDTSRWPTLLAVLEALDNPPFPVTLAACFLALAPDANRPAVKCLSSRLVLSNDDTEMIQWLVGNMDRLFDLHETPWPEAQRLLIAPHFRHLMELGKTLADVRQVESPWHNFCTAKLELPEKELNPAPLITGTDLIDAGIIPGPLFRTLLDQVRDAQLDGAISDANSALELALNLANRSTTE